MNTMKYCPCWVQTGQHYCDHYRAGWYRLLVLSYRSKFWSRAARSTFFFFSFLRSRTATWLACQVIQNHQTPSRAHSHSGGLAQVESQVSCSSFARSLFAFVAPAQSNRGRSLSCHANSNFFLRVPNPLPQITIVHQIVSRSALRCDRISGRKWNDTLR